MKKIFLLLILASFAISQEMILKVTSVSLYDNDANGKLDNIVLQFNTSIYDSILNNYTFITEWYNTSNNLTNIIINSDNLERVDAFSFSYNLSTNDIALLTNIPEEVDFSVINSDTIKCGNTILIDKMAPVITKADYIKNQNSFDTLVVTFSEKLTVGGLLSNQPFNFLRANGEKYTINLESIMSSGTFTPDSIIKFVNISESEPLIGDSISINIYSNISDVSNNKQVNNFNPYVPIAFISTPISKYNYKKSSLYLKYNSQKTYNLQGKEIKGKSSKIEASGCFINKNFKSNKIIQIK